MWLGYGLGIHRNQRKAVFCSGVDMAFICLTEMEFSDELNEKFSDQSFYHYNMGRGN